MDHLFLNNPRRLHPLIITAAVSVIALSATGIASLAGVLPIYKANAATAPVLSAPVSTSAAADESGDGEAAPGTAATETAQTVADPLNSAEPPAPITTKPVAQPLAQPTPKVVRKNVPTAKPAVLVADASAPAYHPTAVSASSSELPPASGEAPMPPPPAISQVQPPPVCANCGTVEGVREVKQQGEANGVGAVAGGLGGAVLGKQFGNGRGSTALAVLGAVGGALAGHEVEKQVRSTTVFEVTVRMEDGSMRTITQANPPPWRNGERVRVEGNAISIL